ARKRRRFKITILIGMPLIISIGLIILVPTMVVQIAEKPEDLTNETTTEEKAVFNELNIDNPIIEVSIQRSKTDKVETIPLELYVTSVFASEMPATFEINALKAQAIAARTYIVNHLLHEEDELISDTVNHQVYRNKEE